MVFDVAASAQTIESALSLFKRGVHGTLHSIGRKQLPRYQSEIEFRHNTRKLSDGERIAAVIKTTESKRANG